MEVVKPAIKGMLSRCSMIHVMKGKQAALAKKRQEEDDGIVSGGGEGGEGEAKLKEQAEEEEPLLLGLSEVAEQFALADNEDTGNFEDYCEMALQYGYVTLFAAAWPMASTIALFNNVVEIRTDAWKFLHGQKMPWHVFFSLSLLLYCLNPSLYLSVCPQN